MTRKYIVILCFLGDPTCPPGSLKGTGGFNASVNQLVGILIRHKEFQFKIITNTTGNYNSEKVELLAPHIALHRIDGLPSDLNNKNDISNQLAEYLEKTREIISDVSNVSFIHSFYWLSGSIAAALHKEYTIPFIHTTVSLAGQKILAGIQPGISGQLKIEKEFLKSAKYILAITESEKKLLRDFYDISDKKIIIEGQDISKVYQTPLYDSFGIPSSFSESVYKESIPYYPENENFFDPSWWTVNAFTFIGRIEKTKGIDIILKAWISLNEKFPSATPPLWIIGNTPSEIDSFRKSLDIPEHLLLKYEYQKQIVWWGYLDATGISTILLKTSVLVTHSLFEAGGRVILEGLCQGIPVIATDTGFAEDYIFNWLNGFIVEYGDIDDLAFRMSHFIMQPFLSSILGQNAKRTYQHIEANWNNTERLLMVYNCMVSGNYLNDKYDYLIPNIEDQFRTGLINSYPYYYKEANEDVVKTFINNYENNIHLLSINVLIQLPNKKIWDYEHKLMVKQIYSKINYCKIYDSFEKTNVFHVKEIVEKLTTITHSNAILPILYKNETYNLFLFPYMEMLNANDLKQNLDSICHCLNKISTLQIKTINIPQKKLPDAWIELKFNIEISGQKSKIYPLSILSPVVDQLLSTNGLLGKHIYLQYGQSIVDHIGVCNHELFLLPTYHWVYSQQGLDASTLLLDILLHHNDISQGLVRELAEEIINHLKIPLLNILCWGVYNCCKYLLEYSLFINHDSTQIEVILYALQNILYETYCSDT